jgi:hypothetical protein
MMVSISVLTPSIALGRNESEASPALGSSLTTPGLMTPTNLCPHTLMCVPQLLKTTGPWGNFGGLAWEGTYELNDKYICPEDDSGTSGCAYYEQLYCSYWGCERWATWLKGKVHTSHGTTALLQKG